MEIKGFITLGKLEKGELIGEWITFPIDYCELHDVMERIGLDCLHKNYYFSGWSGYDFGTQVDVEYVNDIVERIDDIDDDNLIGAMFEIESSDIERVLDRIEGGRYIWYGKDSKIRDIAEEYLDRIMEDSEVPDVVRRHINYDSYADELRIDMKETSYGVLELR